MDQRIKQVIASGKQHLVSSLVPHVLKLYSLIINSTQLALAATNGKINWLMAIGLIIWMKLLTACRRPTAN